MKREALDFEAFTYANGPAVEDPFYTLPEESSVTTPGSFLKAEEVDTSKYSLPPATAMRRIMYQSENLKGSRVPASAYILWPYSPRSDHDGYPVVAWAHGTSGFSVNGAPSNHQSLFQHWFAPFQLALNGYVVVAPDYAGFGVSRHASGQPIVHEYLTLTSHANDVVYAVQAAQQHFRELAKGCFVIGHSQRGGVAWATAQRQTNKPASGYLGAVAIAPLTDILTQLTPAMRELIGAAVEGQQRLGMVHESGAQMASGILLLQGVKLMKDGWTENQYMREFNNRAALGGKEIASPLLIIHGEADERLDVGETTRAVERSVEACPTTSIEYIVLPGVAHTPALTASQRIWMDWIADTFAGREIQAGYRKRLLRNPTMPPKGALGEACEGTKR
ncbi:MAG: hypothetical protein L6R39_007093 [Caloplaca ligustica]|nr:MAG: hypothetical protein L6R39_007093 [Caloplaca ligustica]